MIIHGVSPTDDVSAVSALLVSKKIGLKRNSTLLTMLRKSLKYIAFTEEAEDEKPVFAKNGCIDHINVHNYNNRVMIPLKTAMRIIKKANQGLILKRAERV